MPRSTSRPRGAHRPVILLTLLAVLAGILQTLPAAAAPGQDAPGSLSGTVTNASGQPLLGICVSASGSTDWGSTTTDALGAYRVTGLDPGTYRVFFSDCNQVRQYVHEWYDDAPDWWSADLVAVGDGTDTAGIDAELTLGGSISGTVTDPAGEPIAGICASASGDTYGSGEETDLTGAYSITGLPQGSYRVHFSDCNDTPVFVSEWYDDKTSYSDADRVAVIDGASSVGVDAELSVGGSLSGTVTDDAGQPLDDACVTAYNDDDDSSETASTDASGTYSVAPLAPGRYLVRFSDCHYPEVYLREWYDDVASSSDATRVTVGAEQDTPGIDASLSKAAVVAGTVTDESGAPIPEVCVEASDESGDWEYDQTDPSGSYRLGGLRGGEYRVSFQDCDGDAPDYLSEYYDDEAEWSSADLVTVPEGAEVTGIDAVLGLGGSISGVVTDEQGNPAAEVCVTAYTGNGDWAGQGVTDDSGSYRIRRLRDADHQVRFRPGCGEAQLLDEWYDDQPSRRYSDPVGVRSGEETTGVDAVLSEGGSVSGRVTDEAGEPLEGICVYVDSDYGDYSSVTTGPDGGYRVAGLTGAPHFVSFSDCAGDVFLGEWYDDGDYRTANPVPVRHGVETSGIDAALAVGGSIAGVVMSSQGEPIPEVCIETHDEDWDNYGWTMTDESGAYRIGGLDTGVYELDLYHCDYPRVYGDRTVSPVQVVRGVETAADVELYGVGTITGTLTDESGEPLPEGCVDAFDADGHYADGDGTDASGAFRLSVGGGDYALRFTDCGSGGYATEWYSDKPTEETADVVSVAEGAETSGIDAALAVGGAITGTVTDDAGDPLEQPCVSAVDPTGEWVGDDLGDSLGRYRIEGLAAGAYKLRFSECWYDATHAPEYYDDKPTLEVADVVAVTDGQEVGAVDAQLAVGGVVSGRVTDASGLPIEGVEVAVYGSEWGSYAETDQDGTYRAGGLPMGEYTVSFYWCESGGGCVDEVYDDQTGWETGTPVLVTAGGETGGIDAVLEFRSLLLSANGGLEVAEGGSAADYAMSLGSRPDSDVTVSIPAASELEVSPSSLTFTSDDWNVPQQVSVAAVDDAVAEGIHTVRIDHSVTSQDIVYDGMSSPKLSVKVVDNDRFAPSIGYAGPASGVRGTSVTLAATLADQGTALAGRTLSFRVGGFQADDVTDASGTASVEMPVAQAYGRHTLAISFAGDELSHPASLETDFDVVFEHAFTDDGATVFLNTITKELKFEAPGDVGGVKQVPDMTVDTLASGHTVVGVRYSDGDLTLVGEFELDTGSFAAVVKTAPSQYVLGRPPGVPLPRELSVLGIG